MEIAFKIIRINILFMIALIVVLTSLFSCRSARNIYMADKDGYQCVKLEKINALILKDKEMIDYFSILKKDTLIFHKDTVISMGFHMFFTYDLAMYRASIDTTKNYHEAYYDLEQENLINIKEKKKVIVTCIKNDFTKSESDLEISYWYNSKDNVYSIDIVEILKEPGHKQGYMLLIKDNITGFEILKRSYWTE